MSKPDLIIFDFDGTLADSVGFFRALLPELSRKFGFRLPSFEEQEAMRGHPPR
ncbi:MAG: HAD family hydrolase, partial [Hyphomonas sp. 34-62-18]